MPENDTSSGAGAMPTPETTPATGTTSSGATPPAKPATSIEELQARIAELEHSHKNATEERDRHRKKLSAYEEAERKAQEAQLSEIERIQKQHAELQAKHNAYVQQMQDRIVHYEVERQAHKLGVIDPDAAAKLLDRAAMEYEEDGTPKNAEKLLKDLLKNKPYLAPKPDQQAPATPAQTAQPAAPATPAIPAMNPGRTNIPSPGSVPPGSPRRPPRLSDPGVFSPPGTPSRWQQ